MEERDYPPVPETDLTYVLILDDICPQCLGDFDEGWECNDCGFDAHPYIEDVQ